MNHGGLPNWFFWLLENANYIALGVAVVLVCILLWWMVK